MNQKQIDKLVDLEKRGYTIKINDISACIWKLGSKYVWDSSENEVTYLEDVGIWEVSVSKPVADWENEG